MASTLAEVAAEAVDVILRDGGTLRLRPPVKADADAVLAFFGDLSTDSLSLRFHGARRVDPTLGKPFLDPDWLRHGSLAGWLDDRVVALASYDRIGATETAEVAFVVADREQRRGIGTRLLEHLAARAHERGIVEFVAEVEAGNAHAARVFADTGFELVRELEGGEIQLRFPIAPTHTLAERVEDRNHVGVVASLRPFFAPKSVAVVGASRRRGSIGGELFRNILAADYAGAAYPVNRGGEPVAGVRAYSSIADIPETVDLAVICVPGDSVLEAAESALVSGIRALCVISAGFAEIGTAGRQRQERLLALVRAHGARLVGPNCLGIAVPPLGLNATFAPRPLPAGRIGFSSQSGALGLALLEKASERGLGFSSFVSIGNKADVSSNDLLEWWADDESTDLVLLYLESFGNPRRFADIARRVARMKPIIALKAGTTRTGARAARSHTAALAGSDAAVDALFREAGVLRAHTLEELLDVAGLLSSQPLPAGPRVAVVTNAGGLGILCADACEAYGLELPDLDDRTRSVLASVVPGEASTVNPVDLLGSATAETYEAVIGPMLADENVDALIVIFVPPVVAGADDVARALSRAVERADAGKPVVAVIVSADGTPEILRHPNSKVATLPYPESAARALSFALERSRWLSRPLGNELIVSEGDDGLAHTLVSGEDRWLSPAELRRLLEAYGLPVVAERVAATVEEALAFAHEHGYPVVVKTAEPGAHKTEVGGVALDLRDEDAIRSAVARIGLPVIVQPFVRDGAELLAGIVQDPLFGPLVAFGPGGALAELIGGASFRLAPLTDLDASDLVAAGKAARLLAGFRGAPAADRDAVVDIVARLGRLAANLPEVAELDLNPVLAGPDGCLIVDARARVEAPSTSRRLKGW